MSKKQDIKPKNEHGQRHGLCVCYYNNGNVCAKRRYVNGMAHGIDEKYWMFGDVDYKVYYSKNKWVYAEWYEDYNEIEFYI